MGKWLTRFVLPVVIVAAGVAVSAMLIFRAPQAAPETSDVVAVPVDVVRAVPRPLPAAVTAGGIVIAAQQLALTPEVAGSVVFVSPSFVPGGRFDKGDVLVRIDARDYELAVQQLDGQLERAKLELELELGRQGIAKREWELLGADVTGPQASLALREPHLLVAQQALRAADGAVQAARLRLERTVLRAPFNATVAQKSVDVGQVVGPGAQLGRLVGTDRFWVTVSVPVESLELLEIPGYPATSRGSLAIVEQRLAAGRTIRRSGKILRLVSELDPTTRRAQLLVAIDQPMASDAASLPLLPGAYVDVQLQGRPVDDVITVPRTAVHDGEWVWLVRDGKLASSQIAVRWGDGTDLFVTGGLQSGDEIVTSPLALPVEGMAVNVLDVDTVGSAP